MYWQIEIRGTMDPSETQLDDVLYCPICDREFEREPGESDSDAYLRHGPECDEHG